MLLMLFTLIFQIAKLIIINFQCLILIYIVKIIFNTVNLYF